MKRIILRIGALGTVVVLGLIAIAQAQRGCDDTTGPPRAAANPLRADYMPSAPTEKPAKLIQKPSGSPLRTGELLTASTEDVVKLRQKPSGDPFADRSASPEPLVVAATHQADQLPPDRYPDLRPADLYKATTGGRADTASREPARFFPQPDTIAASSFPQATNSFPQMPAAVASSEPELTGEGTGQPGSEQLDGLQCPQITIQKIAPDGVQVGKATVFKLSVRNTGTTAAVNVVVRDRVPKGTRLIDTTPRASLDAGGEVVWQLGTIEPGEESSVEMKLMPTAEGELGSVATVRFGASASARSTSTKPELVVKTSMAEKVLIGDEVTLSIMISNPGSGTATDVVLEEHIPAGLRHPAGSDLEYDIGDLPPGETRKLELTLVADRPGPVTNVLVAHADAGLKTEDRVDIEVVAPKLDVAMAGPKRRYLECEATYRLSVHNPGTAPANQVELVAYLPSGLKFVSADNAGHYDEANRAVHWRLEELPTGQSGTVELVTMPVESGSQSIRLRGTTEKGLSVEKEQPVVIEGIAAILFQVADVTDPIEVGGETTYEIRVLNQGSKAATNVRLAVLLPPELRPLNAEGPSRHAVEDSRVLFDGLARLAPKADTTYRVRVQSLRPGDLRTRVQLLTDEMRSPVTKEESTQVYADQ